MEAREAAGPDVDVDFFNDLRRVFEKYPDAARKYSISLRYSEISSMKIDFDKQVAVSRVEGNRVVTEFKGISDLMASSGRCLERILERGRWTCVKWAPE